MCDKKNKVLFTDSECLVLSPEFKLPDENQVLLRIPRQNNMYSFNLENIVPSGGLACLIAKATIDESNKWHRRLGHVNFKNLNKLVKGNLVRGLPSKIFQNDHTCVACQKGKQHKASCKAKSVSSISHSLQLLHMDLFGPTSVRSLNHKTYCLVITDDFSSSGGNHRGQSSSDKSLSGNEGDMTLQGVYDLCISLCTHVTDQAKEIKHLKALIKKLKKKAKPVITHHRACMNSVSLKQRLAGKKTLKSVSKQGRKFAKAEPSVHKDPLFDELDDDEIDNMDTEDAQDVERTRNGVNAEKEGTEDAVSTEDVKKDSTDKEKEGTDKDKDSTVSLDEGTDDRTEARSATPITSTTTPTMFGDDETIAQVLLNMSQAKAVSREKEKGVELKDVEETERPRPTSTRSLLTLKPFPKIDPKDNGKKKIEKENESDTESEDIPEAEKKFKQLARDEEIARKLQEDWESEEERKRLAEEEATKTALSDEYDFIQARIEADRLLALRIQDEEREQFTVEERAKFFHDTIAAQRRFLVEQRAIAIKNKPPTRTQLRNQMMTYLKHVGNKKHSDLKSKTFKEIQALYEKVNMFDESFTVVGSTEDERRIKEMNEGVKDTDQKKLKEEDTANVPAKVEVTEQGTKKRKWGHIKLIARKKPRKQSDVDSDDEHRKCLRIVTFEGTID
ncbi:putative ribonuclease H-like domain-containing protein, partial [Tanacetum coccineum]